MKKTQLVPIALSFVAVCLTAFFLWPQGSQDTAYYWTYDHSFDPYISAYSSGEISRSSPIRVRFTSDMVNETATGQMLTSSPFSIKPKISGTTIWEDTRTLKFTPKEELPSGQEYRVKLALGELMDGDIPSHFPFAFTTRPQDIRVEWTSSQSFSHQDQQWHQVQGIVKTLDVESPEKIEKLFEAKFDKEKVKVKWKHDTKKGEHTFTIDSLERKEAAAPIQLSWSGDKVGISVEGTADFEIPAKGIFRHLHTYAYTDPNPFVVIEFTDDLTQRQNITGLVKIPGVSVKTSIKDNKILVYPDKSITGQTKIQVEPGIKSITGDIIDKPYQTSLTFSTVKPAVRLKGKGVIIPKGKTLPFIFEAIGLKSVDVRVIKIYEKNIHQFLQVNQLEGIRELKRVGQVVANKRIPLDLTSGLDLNQWNRHSLDLSSLVNTDPGAIYEVAIGFRQSYSLYTCSSEEVEDRDMLSLGDRWNEHTGDYYYDYGDYYYYDYDERENPCNKAYYRNDRVVKRNVLASDLGLIAKRGTDGMDFFVTNLHTTRPLDGVQLKVYDLQQKLMGTYRTDANGRAKMPRQEYAPFLVVAEQGSQRGYLRLDDGSTLSLSKFDTRGRTYVEGLKGFIYGERGVWRPGDPIYLNFILEDKDQTLPNNHPVSFQLINPKGQVVDEKVSKEGMNGFYKFHTKTDASAITGNYTAKVKVGGANFSKVVKVETIMPNRLKIEMNFGTERLSPSTYSQYADLKSTWLHGAIARGLKADVRANLTPMKTTFGRYQGYNFDDLAGKYESEEVTIFEGNLNDQGIAKIPARISTKKQAPGRLKANFKIKVFEPGGAFSVDRFSIPYDPFDTYVGVKGPEFKSYRDVLETDKDHPINIVTLTADGRPVSRKVEVRVYQLRWRWWWGRSNENIGIYNGKVSAEEISNSTLTTGTNGEGMYQLNIKYPEWGRYLVRVKDLESGHASGEIVYVDWPGYAGRSRDQASDGAQMLTFSAEKETYNVGEDIILNVPTAEAGRMLVSIETGSKVLDAYWVNAEKGITRFRVKADTRMAPNIYAHVTLLQPHAQTKNDLPIRMYGVIPIKVEDPNTHLRPQITMPEKIRPSSQFNVAVSEATGKPMTYTVAVVDEGLLGLTRYKTPDPWGTFYARSALNVKTWDLFDKVVGAYGGEIKSLLSIGGDGANEEPGSQKINRFRPVVKMLGPFTLKPGQKRTHTIDMPNYIGAVRTMVVAGDPDGKYGQAEQSTPVKQPLMVLGTLPRVLGPGERAKLPVTVFAMEDNIKSAIAKVEVGGKLLVNGQDRQVLSFPQPGEKTAAFEVDVLSSIGKTPVKITVTSGNERAVYETDIEIRNPNSRVTNVFAQTIQDGDKWAQPYKPVGMYGTNNGTLEVSHLPSLNLARRLRYLIRYPYGCIEQTTSSVFPQLYLTQLIDLEPERRDKINSNIKAGLERYMRFQRSNGAMAYWPGGYASDWGTNYAGHFMIEAKLAGYTIPYGMLDKLLAYQATQAKDYTYDVNRHNGYYRGDVMIQAYRLYMLALAGKAELGAMNRFRKLNSLPTAAQWFLAGAYYLAGQESVGKRLASELDFDIPEYRELSYTYGSSLRDRGIILMILSRMDQKDRATPLARSISDALCNNNWYSTQTTAYSLLGMAAYGSRAGGKNTKFQYRLKKGDAWKTVTMDSPIWQMDMKEVTTGELEIRNQSGGPLFPRLILDGIPINGDKTSASNGLRMDLVYTDLKGATINPRELEQGTDFIAKVTLTNTGNRYYREMVLNQVFPSGWEITTSRLDGNANKGSKYDYQDIRDDRVYTFFSLGKNKSVTYYVMLNAAYQGRYWHPAVTSEAMYDNTINARVGGDYITIIAPGEGG
ncbi:MAG: MG2 domain-containing protein [Bacteroidota bacterium]